MTFREKQRNMDHWMGSLNGIMITGIVAFILIVVVSPALAWFGLILLFTLIFLIAFRILPFDRRFFMSKINEILGATDKTTAMKLEALARHAGVKLVHVPEHFTCKPIAKKKEVAIDEGTDK